MLGLSIKVASRSSCLTVNPDINTEHYWWLHSNGDLVYSLCSLLTYSLYLISFDQIIVLQMLQLYVK